jgi:hypothetical protein
MTTAQVPVRLSACLGHCAHAGLSPDHHDRLLCVDSEPDALLELLELAMTWHELDYSESPVVAPEHWARFLDSHVWANPELAERAFLLAEDIVSRRGEVRRDTGRMADVIRLVVG